MTKILTVNVPITGEILNRVVDIKPDTDFIKTEDEILALPEWDALRQAFSKGDPNMIYEYKMRLVYSFCSMQQRQVIEGFFKLTKVEDDLETAQRKRDAVLPKKKEVWFDESDSTWKDLINEPEHKVVFENCVFKNTYSRDDANLKAVNEEMIIKELGVKE